MGAVVTCQQVRMGDRWVFLLNKFGACRACQTSFLEHASNVYNGHNAEGVICSCRYMGAVVTCQQVGVGDTWIF